MPSPTVLSLRLLRSQGYAPDVVERILPRCNLKRDLYHCIDIVAVGLDEPILGVQCTSLANVGARIAKARVQPELALWLRAGGRFVVHGWCKRGGKWQVKVVELSGRDMDATVLSRPPRRGRQRLQPGDLFAGLGV